MTLTWKPVLQEPDLKQQEAEVGSNVIVVSHSTDETDAAGVPVWHWSTHVEIDRYLTSSQQPDEAAAKREGLVLLERWLTEQLELVRAELGTPTSPPLSEVPGALLPALTDRTREYRKLIDGRIIVCARTSPYGHGSKPWPTTYIEHFDE